MTSRKVEVPEREDSLEGSTTSDDEFEYDTAPSDVEEAENERRQRIKRLGYRGALTVCEIKKEEVKDFDECADSSDSDHIPGEATPRTPSPDRYGEEHNYMIPLKYRYSQSSFVRRRQESKRKRDNARKEETDRLYRDARARRKRVHTTNPELGKEDRKRARSPTPDESSDSDDLLFDRYL